MQRVRRTLTWIAMAVAWSCGGASVTGVDATPDGISSITVSPSSITLALGGEAPLQATVLDASGHARSDLPVIWSVKDTAIARVSSSGVVSALGVGNTQIAASAGGVSAIATLAVQPPPVASVVVQPLTQSLVLGQSATLTATPRDANGALLTGRVVTWTSSNDAVASVTQSGEVATHAVGTATITATSEGIGGSATVTVSPVPVASITVQPSSVTLAVGATTALATALKDANGGALDRPVTWSSDVPTVATVSAAGVVAAVGAGSATITAQSEGKSATTQVTVNPAPVGAVAVTPGSASVAVGGTVALAAAVTAADGSALAGRIVTWTSSDIGIAVVSATGVVTGVAPGSVTITATSEGKSGTSAVTVARPAVNSVEVQPQSTAVTLGASTTLTATVTDATGAVVPDAPVAWASGNTAVATVSATGVVTGVGLGSATISATSGGRSGSATITVVAIPVGSVSVAPAAATLVPTQVTALTVTVRDAQGNVVRDRAVTWASSNTAVATVSSTGVVTAVAPGSATVTASSGGETGSASITVVRMPVGTVAVSPPTASITVAQTLTLTPTVRDTSGAIVTDRLVTWTSSNTTIATVSGSGVVTAVSAGTAVMTATSEGKSGSAFIAVTSVPVATITLDPASVTITPSQTVTLVATTRSADGAVLTGRAVTFSSGDPNVALVSTSGVVTGVTLGSATITATSEGKTATSTVTVASPPVASVTVQPSAASVQVGATTTLTATAKDASGTVVTTAPITWNSSNTSVATVSGSGVVTGRAVGTATISATSGGRTGNATVNVVPVPVGSVAISPSTATMVPAQLLTLTAVVRDDNNAIVTDRPLTWATTNSAVATVSTSGTVTAHAPGTATVTATSEGKTGTSTITVVPMPVGSVVVSPSTASVTAGSTVVLSATMRDTSGAIATGRAVTWTSSDATIASVFGAGVVTGVSPGTATITATSEGKSGHAVVTVLPVPVAFVTLAPTSVTLNPGQTATLTATTKSADGTVLTGRVVTFGSDDVGVAQVSSDGVVTGVAPGTASITATSEGQVATATVTVQPAVAYVAVAPSSVFVRRNGTVQLSVTAYDAGGHAITGRSVTWASGDEHLATVSSTGLVTAKRTGTVTITATIDGKSDSSQLTITN